jgi:hypothetical protein
VNARGKESGNTKTNNNFSYLYKKKKESELKFCALRFDVRHFVSFCELPMARTNATNTNEHNKPAFEKK